jgi:hypothetical protein
VAFSGQGEQFDLAERAQAGEIICSIACTDVFNKPALAVRAVSGTGTIRER